VVGKDELAEIARAGYAEAASTDRKGREAAISLFLADAVLGGFDPSSTVRITK
jgi:hypothetical protein